MKTYKYIIIFLIILEFCLFHCAKVVAMPYYENEQMLSIDYSKFSKDKLNASAKSNFEKALEETDLKVREKYLKSASVQYALLTKLDPDNIDNFINLGRIYDMQSLDKLAKSNFSNALGVDIKNVMANYYFAEFFYNRKNYQSALQYYHKAFQYGYEPDFQTLKKVGYIYERYGDLERAKLYYKKCISINQNEELSKKIQEIEGLNYSSTGYDKKKLRKIKNETN